MGKRGGRRLVAHLAGGGRCSGRPPGGGSTAGKVGGVGGRWRTYSVTQALEEGEGT